jgi:dTMP kinase
MPIENAMSLLGKRSDKGDIHETDAAYLQLCRESALQAAELYGWKRVNCAEGGKIRSEDKINAEIYEAVKGLI